MEAIGHPKPRTADEVFNDFKGRRSGLIKALTTGELLFLFLRFHFFRFDFNFFNF